MLEKTKKPPAQPLSTTICSLICVFVCLSWLKLSLLVVRVCVCRCTFIDSHFTGAFNFLSKFLNNERHDINGKCRQQKQENPPYFIWTLETVYDSIYYRVLIHNWCHHSISTSKLDFLAQTQNSTFHATNVKTIESSSLTL